MGTRGHSISQRLKQRIVALYLIGRKSISQIARECGTTRGTARSNISAYKRSRNKRKGVLGRKHALDKKASARAEKLLVKQHLTAKACALQLFNEGLTKRVVSKHTLAKHAMRHAKSKGKPITCKEIRLRNKLTSVTKQHRLDFCKEHERDTFKNVMFTDRCKFLFKHPGEIVQPGKWRYVGQPIEVFTSHHPQAFNVYGGITPYGTTQLHEVTGTTGYHPATKYTTATGSPSRNITLQEYYDVLMKGLLPDGHRLFRGHDWVIQQDNDPTHRRASQRAVHDWNESLNKRRAAGGRVSILQRWPPNSPDLSIIENCWAITNSRVLATKCDTFADFTRAVRENFQKINATPLYASIPSRIMQCISAQGGRTRH